ncbi:hypothetical protein, partial [Clostridioides difficile]|uniref:hypothetical protein n=1 Tax=Clostridioides difficile TaxID=1496 RepID=UPI001FD8AB6C
NIRHYHIAYFIVLNMDTLILAFTKILALFAIFIVMFVVCISIYLAIYDLTFGAQCLKISFQMLFFIISLIKPIFIFLSIRTYCK